MELHFSADSEWSLALLQAAIGLGQLEVLTLLQMREEHLRAAHAAPGLRALTVTFPDASLRQQPPELPALTRPSTLRVLRVGPLPKLTLASLLRAHRDSLSFLELGVAVADRPAADDALGNLLAACGLARVRMLVLLRLRLGHSVARCRRQIEKVRRALPALQTVLCNRCDDEVHNRFTQEVQNAIMHDAAAPLNRA